MHIGELLASAGDDGNVLLWTPSEIPTTSFGDDNSEDLEHWRVKTMCRSSSGSEIYDLALGSAGIHRAMKRIKEQYNLPIEERDQKACKNDLTYVASQMPAKYAASQYLHEELGKVRGSAAFL